MLIFENVTKRYKDKYALDDVTFAIDEGEFVFLVGPSGAGKSTVVKLAIQQEKPTSGKIIFNSRIRVDKLSGSKLAKYRSMIGIIFQDFKLIETKTVWENVAFVLEVCGKPTREIKKSVEYVLDLVGLLDKKDAFPKTLSGGEQQRVAIARAVVNEPLMLIADEPTGNLDRNNTWDIIQLLNKINNWGTTVIVATHDVEVVNSLNKRVIAFENGKIIRDYIGGYEL